MKINKITNGFVVQTFDTVKMGYVSQNFTAGDVEYEHDDETGTPLDQTEAAELGMEFEDGSEPYLPFDMIQPLAVENCREQIQNDLLCLLDDSPLSYTAQTLACQIVLDNFKKFFQK